MAEKNSDQAKSDEGKLATPKHKKRVKSFVDLNPSHEPIKEEVDQRLDLLIRLGLGDPAHLSFYRKALADPRAAVTNVQYRQYAGSALETLIELILADTNLYNRVRMLLQSRSRKLSIDEVLHQAMELRSNK